MYIDKRNNCRLSPYTKLYKNVKKWILCFGFLFASVRPSPIMRKYAGIMPINCQIFPKWKKRSFIQYQCNTKAAERPIYKGFWRLCAFRSLLLSSVRLSVRLTPSHRGKPPHQSERQLPILAIEHFNYSLYTSTYNRHIRIALCVSIL